MSRPKPLRPALKDCTEDQRLDYIMDWFDRELDRIIAEQCPAPQATHTKKEPT